MDIIHLPSLLAGIVTAVLIGTLLFNVMHWRGSAGRHDAVPHPAAQEMRRDIAEQLGLTREELLDELARGKSMADIARERGIELALPPRWMRDEDRQIFLERMADRLGLSMDELKEELSSGKQLLDIAQERGVELVFPKDDAVPPQ